jgi:hypothetical protein
MVTAPSGAFKDDDGAEWGGGGLPVYEEVAPMSRVAVCVVSTERELPGENE